MLPAVGLAVVHGPAVEKQCSSVCANPVHSKTVCCGLYRVLAVLGLWA